MWRTGVNGSIILVLTLCLSTFHTGRAADCIAEYGTCASGDDDVPCCDTLVCYKEECLS